MKLFVFGLGYTASAFVRSHGDTWDAVSGTVRSDDKADALARDGIVAYRFSPEAVDPRIDSSLSEADALLVSVQPGHERDPVLERFGDAIAASPVRRIVYLSTIGVYGNHDGAWIDESAATDAFNARQAARIVAEQDWLSRGASMGAEVRILRLAGIYGPGRNALDDLSKGEARRIDKPRQVFNRIHVADIGQAIRAALSYRGFHTVINVTDDEPAPAPDVVAYAAALAGRAVPPSIPFEDAALSPMARSFYGANRRVSNRLLTTELGVALRYPTYREGLDALWAAGEGRS